MPLPLRSLLYKSVRDWSGGYACVPPALVHTTTPARRWARRDAICIAAYCTMTARAGCAWLSVLRVQHTVLLHNIHYRSTLIMTAPLNWAYVRDANICPPLPSLTHAFAPYCTLQKTGEMHMCPHNAQEMKQDGTNGW